MEILQHIDQAMNLVQAIAFVVITVAAIVVSLSVKHSSAAERAKAAAEQAVRYVEQWRIMRLKAGEADLTSEVLKSMAREIAQQLLDGVPTEKQNLDVMLEAAVNLLPKTKVPARGADGKFTAAN